MADKPRLRPPEFLLSDFYEAGSVFNPRSSWRHSGRLATDLLANDFSTGAPLPIGGTLPVICSSAVCSDRGQRLLAAAGLPENGHTVTYGNEADYESILADCRRRKRPVIFQFPPFDGEYPRELYWIEPDLHRELNSNACLPEIVPEQYVPERTVLTPCELPAFLKSASTWPVVLKGATNGPGGQAVAIIRTARELDQARSRLQFSEQIVAEEFLSIEDNYCVYCATDGRETFLLGCCDRITNEAGRYQGDWISLVRHPPPEVIEAGFEIMQRAAKRGYVGVAGFETVRDSRGRILVIDLNFHLDESTPALLWQQRLLSRSGPKSVGRVIRWGFRQTVDPDWSQLRELVASGWFFPLTIYDPQASPYRFDEVRATGILFGSSRYQIEQRLQKLLTKFGTAGSKSRAA